MTRGAASRAGKCYDLRVQRSFLIAAAVAVTGALLALAIWSRQSSNAAPSADDEPSPHPTDKVEHEGRANQPRADRPALNKPPPPLKMSDRKSAPADREYVNKRGQMVRDHRGPDKPDYNPEVVKSPKKQKVEPRVVQGVRDSVYETVRECRQTLDPSAYGDKPKAQAEILLSIEEGQVSTDQALVKLSGMNDKDVGKAFATCVQERAEQLAFPAAGHEKVSQYRVTLVFPLR